MNQKNPTTPEARSVASILPRIAATLAPAPRSTITLTPQDEKRLARKRCSWNETRLKMDLYHPQLKNMLVVLYDFVIDVFYRKPGRLVILHGPNGCGKTKAAKAVLAWFNNVRMQIGPVTRPSEVIGEESDAVIPNCLYCNWPREIDLIKQDQWMVFDLMLCEYLVILDDIGAEHDPSGIGLEKLYMALSRRENRHTLITTNFSPEQWPEKFERRITSRLFRNSTLVDLTKVPDFNTR